MLTTEDDNVLANHKIIEQKYLLIPKYFSIQKFFETKKHFQHLKDYDLKDFFLLLLTKFKENNYGN
mgnify:FL=1